MKHSSVEWMVEQIEKSSKEGDIDFLLWNLKQNLLVEAKAMHKEEIRKAYWNGEYHKEKKLTIEYYNETFNTEEK